MTEPEKTTTSVLLVDDDAVFRLGLKYVLSQAEDLKVIAEASDGNEAVQLAVIHKPDVVVMDIAMPILDGIDSVRAIRQDNPQVKIVMLTAHGSENLILAALAAGANGYCLKDVDPARLYVAIRAVAAGDLWLDTGIAKILVRILPKASAEFLSGPRTKAQLKKTDLEPVLSEREKEILNLIISGFTNHEIGEHLGISAETVKTHIRHIMEKLAASDRTQAVIKAVKRGLV